jgi:hypothetical protein
MAPIRTRGVHNPCGLYGTCRKMVLEQPRGVADWVMQR